MSSTITVTLNRDYFESLVAELAELRLVVQSYNTAENKIRTATPGKTSITNNECPQSRFKRELKDLLERLPVNDSGNRCFPVHSEEHELLDPIIDKMDLLFKSVKPPRGSIVNETCDFKKWKVCDCFGLETCTHEENKGVCMTLKMIVDYISKVLEIDSSPTNASRTFSPYFQDRLKNKFPGIKICPRKGKSVGSCAFLVPIK